MFIFAGQLCFIYFLMIFIKVKSGYLTPSFIHLKTSRSQFNFQVSMSFILIIIELIFNSVHELISAY